MDQDVKTNARVKLWENVTQSQETVPQIPPRYVHLVS